jgi:glycosyltransferase involved in cell wall biosynthesis
VSSIKLTIGMASYNNYAEVWFTVQALRLYQDLTNTEILVIDNFGENESMKNFVTSWAQPQARYIQWTEANGTAIAKNKVFEHANGEWVICIDSHVLLAEGALKRFRAWADAHPNCKDLLHGPLLYDDLRSKADAFNDEWRGQMWGTWRGMEQHLKDETIPYEIPMMGMGLFGCRRDAWLGFNPDFRGFGGEEGYIHTKFKQAGNKVLCLPWLKWNHHFRDGSGKGAPPFTPLLRDKIRNYVIGFRELGLDLRPIFDHFGENEVRANAGDILSTQTTTSVISAVASS